jgi:hypothetical protein
VEYRGFEYNVVQTANPTGWKWVISLDEIRTKAGTAYNRASAVRFAELAITKHLKRCSGHNGKLPMPVRTASE